jgi:hypothetical protein
MKKERYKMIDELFLQYKREGIKNQSEDLKNWNIIKEAYKVNTIQEFINLLIKRNKNFKERKEYKIFDKDRESKLRKYRSEREFLSKDKNNRMKKEHTIEYYLLGKEDASLGTFIAYELPCCLFNQSGGVDLVSYNGVLNLIELKACEIKGEENVKKASNESLLRAVLEIATYYSYIINLSEDGFNIFKNELLRKYNELTKKNIFFDKEDIVMCVLVPKSIYKSCNNKLLDEILKLEKFKFYYIKQIKPIKNNTKIGVSEDKIFEISEYKHNV